MSVNVQPAGAVLNLLYLSGDWSDHLAKMLRVFRQPVDDLGDLLVRGVSQYPDHGGQPDDEHSGRYNSRNAPAFEMHDHRVQDNGKEGR
ncbi:MAG: hypothetical protein WBR26_17770 [Candidatus Acidiferrum sp.]